MISILGNNYNDTNDIKKILLKKYKNKEFDDCGNVSIINASFIADKSYIIRKPNEDYIKRELKWYLSESLNVNDIPGNIPQIWLNIADKNGYINSNYGWTTFSKENHEQFKNVVNELKKNKSSRQGVIIFIRPTMHQDSKLNGRHDFICTYCYNFKIENNTLYMIVNMRSNDCVFGYNNDFAFADYVFDKMLYELKDYNLKKGVIFWNADNFHVYPRHFKYLEELENDYENKIN